MENARKIAVDTLVRVEKDGSYSNLVLNDALTHSTLSVGDKALASAIFYGVLDRRITLDYILKQFIKTPLKKVAPFTRNALRAAVYQINYMDKIPDSAAVNEAVKLVKASKEKHCAGFANAVLRNLLRNGVKLPDGNKVSDLSVRFSCPEWIVNEFCKDYGNETAERLLASFLEAPPVFLRVNTVKTTSELLMKRLEEEGVSVKEGKVENSLILKNVNDISSLLTFKEGLFHVQDEACQTAVSVLSPKVGERVLDTCASPGGKSFTMAELMENRGEITACDIHEHRARLIENNAKRLGLDIVNTVVCDATERNVDLGLYDRILCDVPCSGLGVLRRKPDIKYRAEEDYSALEETQKKILKNALMHLKKGGCLLYSTCTLRRAENERLVNSVIMEYNDVIKKYERTFMPHIDNTDGFYCALLVREGETPFE